MFTVIRLPGAAAVVEVAAVSLAALLGLKASGTSGLASSFAGALVTGAPVAGGAMVAGLLARLAAVSDWAGALEAPIT